MSYNVGTVLSYCRHHKKHVILGFAGIVFLGSVSLCSLSSSLPSSLMGFPLSKSSGVYHLGIPKANVTADTITVSGSNFQAKSVVISGDHLKMSLKDLTWSGRINVDQTYIVSSGPVTGMIDGLSFHADGGHYALLPRHGFQSLAFDHIVFDPIGDWSLKAGYLSFSVDPDLWVRFGFHGSLLSGLADDIQLTGYESQGHAEHATLDVIPDMRGGFQRGRVSSGSVSFGPLPSIGWKGVDAGVDVSWDSPRHRIAIGVSRIGGSGWLGFDAEHDVTLQSFLLGHIQPRHVVGVWHDDGALRAWLSSTQPENARYDAWRDVVVQAILQRTWIARTVLSRQTVDDLFSDSVSPTVMWSLAPQVNETLYDLWTGFWSPRSLALGSFWVGDEKNLVDPWHLIQ